MLFNSIEYLLFLPVVLLFVVIFKKNLTTPILLIASYYFYYYGSKNLLILILISTLIDFFISHKIYKTKSKVKRKQLLFISIFTNLFLLFTYKYLDFSIDIINRLFSTTLPLQKLPLPVGISFYTFQTMAYTIDVYNKKIKPEKSLKHFALFVCYFPQLVAGPIESAKNLLPQLKKPFKFNFNNFTKGLTIILYGVFIKTVIADRLALFVNDVYNNPYAASSANLLLCAYLFAFQIYFDFSGYTNIAIGTAKIFGVNLSKNFNTPYFSHSVQNFWQRWHITLSNWFKNYVYFPLGGSRKGLIRTLVNIFIVFLVSGLWHGASYNFVIWGLLHGFYIFIETIFSKQLAKIPKLLRIFITFNLVVFSWIFFRVPRLNEAFYVIKKILSNPLSLKDITFNFTYWQQNLNLAIFFTLIVVFLEYLYSKNYSFYKLPLLFKYIISIVTIFIIIIFSVNRSDFLYFAF